MESRRRGGVPKVAGTTAGEKEVNDVPAIFDVI